jgi:surface antigen
MKKLLAAIMIVALWGSVAHADWLDNFKKLYQEENIEIAVDNAIQEGIAPDVVTKNALKIATVNPQNLVKALYCAGVSGEDVYTSAQNSNISSIIVAAGFKKSVEECGDMVTDIQPYTPGGRQGRGFGGANRGQRGRPYASPSTF